MPVGWSGSGGKDDWELVYLPEEIEKPSVNGNNNNNEDSHENLNLVESRKVRKF